MFLILVIKFCQQNFSNKDIINIHFKRRFQNFIGGISTKCLYINVGRKTLLLQGLSEPAFYSDVV